MGLGERKRGTKEGWGLAVSPMAARNDMVETWSGRWRNGEMGSERLAVSVRGWGETKREGATERREKGGGGSREASENSKERKEKAKWW